MASRPAVAALGCLQCRSAFFRAVTSTSFSSLRAPSNVSSLPTRTLVLPLRSFATTTTPNEPPTAEEDSEAPPKTEDKEEDISHETTAQADGEATPWYLEVEPPQHAPTQHVAPLPEIPEGSPPIFEPLLKYVYEEMGLDDMTLLDLRDMDPPPALGPNLMMLFGTARSERHLHVSSSRLVKWLRYNYRIESRADGLIGPGELKTKLRRLRKRAKLMGSSALPLGGDDGISTGWICVNLGSLGSSLGESARYDDDGKVSGFGSSTMGTTIVVQVMTESRRSELNLEQLWGGQLRRSRESEEALKVDEEEFIRKFGKKPPPMPRPKPAPRPQRGQRFGSVQKRAFSTSRVLAALDAFSSPSLQSNPTKEVNDVVYGGKDITNDQALKLLADVLNMGKSADREIDAALLLLRTMHERGMSVLNNDTIVTLIESLSRHRGAGLEQVQSNLEHLLMRGVTKCPSEEHLKRLLTVFLSSGKWSRYWDIWQIPPRHAQPRSADLYVFVLHQALETQEKPIIEEVLRTVVPSMEHETPPVLPVGQVWTTLKQCLLVVDPAAEELSRLLGAKPLEGHDDPVNRRRKAEFVRMYRRLDTQNREAQRLGLF